MKKFEIWLGLARIPIDAIAVILAFLVARSLRKVGVVVDTLSPIQDMSFFEAGGAFYDYLLPLTIFLLIVFAFNNLYGLKTVDSYSVQIKNIFLSVVVWTMSIITYYFLVRDFPFSRFVLLIAALLIFVFVCVGRLLMHSLQNRLLKNGIGTRKLLIFADNSPTLQTALNVLANDFRYEIVGYCAQNDLNVDAKYIGVLNDADLVSRLGDFDNILQIGTNDWMKNLDLLNFSRFYHKQYQYVPDILEMQSRSIVMSEVKGLPVFTLRQTPLDGWWRVVKRVFDLVASLLGLIVLAPFLLLVALLIKIDSKGPILFKYLSDGSVVKRIGYKGKEFYCYKFRTMQNNTHELRYTELADNDLRKGTPLVKISDDPRVTNFGKFLRRFDIDELPQLLNVVLGQMSLVGPRPHLREEVDKYARHHRVVLNVKPGITGLAQISGRSDLDFEDEVRLDMYYIENWSLWMDIKILLKTVLVVFKGHGEVNS